MKKGFTLIELLVVVLIIGILSAVALPQYNLAVQKARVMKLLPLMKAIDTAEKVYYMENGTYTAQWDDLAISMPGGGNLLSNGQMKYKDFRCFFQGFPDNPSYNQSFYCQGSDDRSPWIEKYFSRNYYICWSDSAYRDKLCKSISGKAASDLNTIDGLKGYTF